MSDAIGPIAVPGNGRAGVAVPGVDAASERTQELLDEEARRIVEEAERAVVGLLRDERSKLDALATALLERETLDQADAYRTAGVDVPDLDAVES